MKRNLLFLVTLLLSIVTGYAQGDSKDNAKELVIGDNDYLTKETSATCYYKYTADSNQALVLAVDNQNWKFNIQTYVYRYADDSSVGYVFFPSPNQHYLLKKGEEVYIKVTGYPYSNLDGAEWNMKVTASVLSGDEIQEFAEHGLSAEDPITLVDGKMHFFNGGNDGATVYFTYTATVDGILALKTNLWGNVYCNDVNMKVSNDNGLYVMKADVEKGKTYTIYAESVYGLGCIIPSCYVPEAGSIDKPYDLKDVNTVPSAAGKYYYVGVPKERCYVKVSSEETLPGAESWVKLYNSLSNVNYDNPVLTTENGSFNISYEMKSYGDEVFYVVVNKAEATDAAQSFNFAFAPFQPGDIFEKPLDAEAENVVSGVGTDGNGVRYYKYVPSIDGRLTVTVVPADAENSNVKVTFPLDSWNVLTAMQNGNAYTVFAESAIPYIVKLEGVKEGDKVLFAENEFQKGDRQDDPIELVNGVEVSLGGGIIPERWYSYTNTEGEALNFVVDNLPLYIYGQVAYGIIPEDGDDPLMTDVSSSNGEEFTNYSAIIPVAPGQTCIFKIAFREDCANGTIKVEEGELPEGITYGKPIVIDNGSVVTLPAVSNAASARWLKATLYQNDKLTIDSDNYCYYETYVGLDNVINGNYNYTDYYFYTGPGYPGGFTALESADFYFKVYYHANDGDLRVSIERDPTSGINEVNANADFNLNGNVLTVAGNAKVYSLDGAMVGEITNNSSLNLNKGVYLINVNGTVKKVMVK